uniref:Moricin-like peptide B n=1 Tax=Galleria mellonella TaxID=7137 RepID=A5JSU6_GALME|nr:moricin-like peptide B [Galleria mellonella]
MSIILVVVMMVMAMFVSSGDAAPGKIPVKAIKKGGQIIGKALRGINIASTAHDIISQFKPKKKKNH